MAAAVHDVGRHVAMTVMPCTDESDRDIFLPRTAGQLAAAKRVCRTCTVATQCLALGQRSGATGVYGGQLLRKGRPAVHFLKERRVELDDPPLTSAAWLSWTSWDRRHLVEVCNPALSMCERVVSDKALWAIASGTADDLGVTRTCRVCAAAARDGTAKVVDLGLVRPYAAKILDGGR